MTIPLGSTLRILPGKWPPCSSQIFHLAIFPKIPIESRSTACLVLFNISIGLILIFPLKRLRLFFQNLFNLITPFFLMAEKAVVISLGGSRIVPDEVDEKFLLRFKKLVDYHPSWKFVAITGGGSTARRYMSALRTLGKKTKDQSISGMAVTRFHAGFLARFFGKKANSEIPTTMKKIKDLLRKNQIVFAGALRYEDKNTSDSTSAKVAAYLNTPFINLTNVKGLYTSDPRKNKNAKVIKRITWKKFDGIAKKIKFEAGQHFVLDQTASKIILKNEIPTYIVGSLTAVDKILRGKDFEGTLISG